MSHICTATVSDHTGFHFHQCGKPAKWWVRRGHRLYPCCGLHAKPTAFKPKRIPITASEGEKSDFLAEAVD